MGSIPFFVAIACVGVIIFWYLRDEGVYGGKGRGGVLDMNSPDREKRSPEPSWKVGKPKPWKAGRR
jgi:hypothetical protein